MNESTYHLIDQYLSGELVGVELDKFKAAMKEDDELKKAVDIQRLIIKSIEQVREEELRAYLKEQTQTRRISIPRKGWAILSTAAVITLLSAVTIVLLQNRDQATTETVQEASDSIDHGPAISTTDTSLAIDSLPLERTAPIEDLAVAVPPPTVELSLDEALDQDVETTEEIVEINSEMPEDATVSDNGVKHTYSAPPQSRFTNKDSNSNVYKGSQVRSDQLVSSRTISINKLNMELNRTDEDGVYDIQEKKSRRRDKKEGYLEEAESAERSITIEHWKSVVNYVGYHYNGSTIQLYGIKASAVQKVQELDNRLYLQLDGKQYFIEVNKTYNRLVEVTNPLLLNVLNE